MKNKGKHIYRFQDNPVEKLFAEEWEENNINHVTKKLDGKGILDYLLAENSNRPMGEVTNRDREVAATVIQWLGSPVGQNFIRNVLIKKRNAFNSR